MRTIARRLLRLEALTCAVEADKPRKQIRLVIRSAGRNLDLARSFCKRTLNTVGGLTELVTLHGSRKELTDQQLEDFVTSFPIERA